MSLFIVSLNYLRPITEIEKYLNDHVAFLDKYYAEGIFIFSGRKVPRTGGAILAFGITKEELEGILEDDPFRKNNLAAYDILEIQPTKWHAEFKAFIDQ